MTERREQGSFYYVIGFRDVELETRQTRNELLAAGDSCSMDNDTGTQDGYAWFNIVQLAHAS